MSTPEEKSVLLTSGFINRLPITEYLMVETLLARFRLGEDTWNFPLKHQRVAESLSRKGIASYSINPETKRVIVELTKEAIELSDDLGDTPDHLPSRTVIPATIPGSTTAMPVHSSSSTFSASVPSGSTVASHSHWFFDGPHQVREQDPHDPTLAEIVHRARSQWIPAIKHSVSTGAHYSKRGISVVRSKITHRTTESTPS